MTILYKTVLIESAEQAEALPVGTVAFAYGPLLGACYTKDAVDNWKGERLGWDDSDADMVGWTALVPIEAEYEHGEQAIAEGEFIDLTRLVTPWAEVSDRP